MQNYKENHIYAKKVKKTCIVGFSCEYKNEILSLTCLSPVFMCLERS